MPNHIFDIETFECQSLNMWNSHCLIIGYDKGKKYWLTHIRIAWIKHKSEVKQLITPIIKILEFFGKVSTYCCNVVHAIAIVVINGSIQHTTLVACQSSEFVNPAAKVAPAVKNNRPAGI